MSETMLRLGSLSAHDRQILAQTTAADFDGHTGFASLTPTERLQWLDNAVEFFSSAPPVGGALALGLQWLDNAVEFFSQCSRKSPRNHSTPAETRAEFGQSSF